MKNKKTNAAQIWKQLEDHLVPRLRLSITDRAIYSHLLRHSRLEGKRRLRFSILWLALGARLCTNAAPWALRRLIAHGVLLLVERSKAGPVVEVRPPAEIPAVPPRRTTPPRLPHCPPLSLRPPLRPHAKAARHFTPQTLSRPDAAPCAFQMCGFNVKRRTGLPVKRLIERKSACGYANKATAVPTSLDFLMQLHLFNSPRPKVHQNYDRTISETKLYPLEASPRFVA